MTEPQDSEALRFGSAIAKAFQDPLIADDIKQILARAGIKIEEERELTPKTYRIDMQQMARLQKKLGLNDEAKVIRSCMNCAENVIQNFFGGEVQAIFERSNADERQPKYKINQK